MVVVVVEEVVEVMEVVEVHLWLGGPGRARAHAGHRQVLQVPASCLAADYRSSLCLQIQSYFKYFFTLTNKSFNHN